MAINEKIVTNRKHRKLIDKESKLWQRISFWSKASDVEFDDGKTAQNKLGAINGITSDYENFQNNDIAASIGAIHEVNENMNGIFGGIKKFIVDQTTGKITGYQTEWGADTVFPFFDQSVDFTMIVHIDQAVWVWGKAEDVGTVGPTGNDNRDNNKLGFGSESHHIFDVKIDRISGKYNINYPVGSGMLGMWVHPDANHRAYQQIKVEIRSFRFLV